MILSHDISFYDLNISFSGSEIKAYLINDWKYNEIRKHPNVSEQTPEWAYPGFQRIFIKALARFISY